MIGENFVVKYLKSTELLIFKFYELRYADSSITFTYFQLSSRNEKLVSISLDEQFQIQMTFP